MLGQEERALIERRGENDGDRQRYVLLGEDEVARVLGPSGDDDLRELGQGLLAQLVHIEA